MAAIGCLATAVGLTVPAAPAANAESRPATIEVPTTASLMRTVGDLVGFAPRSTGSPGGLKAAGYVAGRFRKAGLTNVHYETATSYDWKPSDYSLKVGGTAIDAFPISHSFINSDSAPSTKTLGPGGRAAQVVDIGDSGSVPASAKGKWVVFNLKFQVPLLALLPVSTFVWDPRFSLLDPAVALSANPFLTNQEDVVEAAAKAGAAGVIGVLDDYFESNKYHNEDVVTMRMPGMWITKKTGARLRSLLAKNGNRATMKLTVKRRAVTARTVVGFLEGKTKDTVMVQSHHDSQGPGAVEDGTGTAAVIGLADYYGARAAAGERRDKTLMFVTMDTHFTGYESHQALVKKYITDKKTPYRIVANASVEHIAKRAVTAKDGSLKILDQTEPRGIFQNVSQPLQHKLNGLVVRHDMRSTAVLNAPLTMQILGAIPTDADYLFQAEIPTISLISGPLYLYDEADTIDKVDQKQMRPTTKFFAGVIDMYDAAPSSSIAP
ncbi:M28 family peptidase [Spirillospora sp. NPDC050679]